VSIFGNSELFVTDVFGVRGVAEESVADHQYADDEEKGRIGEVRDCQKQVEAPLS